MVVSSPTQVSMDQPSPASGYHPSILDKFGHITEPALTQTHVVQAVACSAIISIYVSMAGLMTRSQLNSL